MTVSTTQNFTSYVGDGVETVFSFAFQAQQESDMFGLVDGVVDPNTTTQLNADQEGNPGGTVTFGVAPPDQSVVTLLRELPETQLVDYQEFDPFPAETHEGALDKLTMVAQQSTERITASLRFPVGDNALTVYPAVPLRAEKYAYFDVDGNVTTIDVAPQAAAIQEISIASDSTSVMRVTTSQDGATPINPHIGFNNINKALGALQLNEQGFVPIDNLNIIGIQIRGPFRGDDLCPKPNDEVGDCNPPDTRNPTQRLTELVFTNGDAFIVTMQDPEVAGTMDLFEAVGDAASQILDVKSSDTIIFLEADGLGVIEGWYLFPKLLELGAASDISYDDSGNTYVLGANVQVALDATDGALIQKDQWIPNQRSVGREAFVATNLNVLVASGIYVSAIAAAGNPTADAPYTVHHIIRDTDNMTQIAVNNTNNQVYVRSSTANVYSAWVIPFDLSLKGYLDTGLHVQFTGDPNSIIANSVYHVFADLANFPTDIDAAGRVIMTTDFWTTNDTIAVQTLVGLNAGNAYKTWQRQKLSAGSWSTWLLLIDGSTLTIDASGNRTSTGNTTAPRSFANVGPPNGVNELTRKDYVDSNPTMVRTGDRLDITNVSTS